MGVEQAVRRFACTQCGACCNRSPEVELSEAAALADVFVFRLMFRLYWLPNQHRDSLSKGEAAAKARAIFYEKKRLLGAFAARRNTVKVRRDGKSALWSKYLVVSALALDTSPGACSALKENLCGVHNRRPLSCRSVPFHYSRTEASAEADLQAFVETAGYYCDTSEAADVVLENGRIVAPEMAAARSEAIATAERDQSWSEAIVRRMSNPSANHSLPSLMEVEASSQLGATTTSMRVAWQIAAEVGLLDRAECERLIKLQLEVIDRELSLERSSRDGKELLAEMREEYRHYLNAHQTIVWNSE